MNCFPWTCVVHDESFASMLFSRIHAGHETTCAAREIQIAACAASSFVTLIVDLFNGTRGMTKAWESSKRKRKLRMDGSQVSNTEVVIDVNQRLFYSGNERNL